MATPFPFGSGNTLLASQLNAITTLPVSTKTASHTLTIADLGTRVVMNSASATTITVNTSIFGASDKVEILNIGAGVCTVTAGTCTVGSSGTLALVQNAGGTLTFISASASVFTASAVAASTAGLVCVKAETAFTAASTITADNVFSSSFTNYILHMTSSTATNANATLQLRTGGVTSTGANYNGQSLQASSTTISGARNAAATSVDFFTTSAGTTLFNFAQMTIYQPQLAQPTGFHAFSHFHNSASYGQPLRQDFFSNNSLTTAFDGFIVTLSSGSMTGTFAVYGYSKTV